VGRHVLAGDIGGTKTLLAVYEEDADGSLRLIEERSFPSRDYASFESLLDGFSPARATGFAAAGFGVAGPVYDGVSRLTNLSWVLDERLLGQWLRGAPVRLLNDVEAAGWGMLGLAPEEVAWIHAGLDPQPVAGGAPLRGNIAVLAPGTGLGEAMLSWDGHRYNAVAGEGGHADFAPRTDIEMDLVRYLRALLGGRVSVERVLSGPGLVHLYEFLRDSGGGTEAPGLREKMASGDPAAVIAEAGLRDADPLCRGALDLFASALGAEAANMALRVLARGGVFLAGGIAPKILAALQAGSFVRAYRDKGRFSEFVGSISVRVCLNPRASLLGAARAALDAAGQSDLRP
jgi:glucokinase